MRVCGGGSVSGVGLVFGGRLDRRVDYTVVIGRTVRAYIASG